MKTDYLELYTDYLISSNGYTTATGLSDMMDNEVLIVRRVFKNKDGTPRVFPHYRSGQV